MRPFTLGEPSGNGDVSGRRRVLEDGLRPEWESPRATSFGARGGRTHGGWCRRTP